MKKYRRYFNYREWYNQDFINFEKWYMNSETDVNEQFSTRKESQMTIFYFSSHLYLV